MDDESPFDALRRWFARNEALERRLIFGGDPVATQTSDRSPFEELLDDATDIVMRHGLPSPEVTRMLANVQTSTKLPVQFPLRPKPAKKPTKGGKRG